MWATGTLTRTLSVTIDTSESESRARADGQARLTPARRRRRSRRHRRVAPRLWSVVTVTVGRPTQAPTRRVRSATRARGRGTRAGVTVGHTVALRLGSDPLEGRGSSCRLIMAWVRASRLGDAAAPGPGRRPDPTRTESPGCITESRARQPRLPYGSPSFETSPSRDRNWSADPTSNHAAMMGQCLECRRGRRPRHRE